MWCIVCVCVGGGGGGYIFIVNVNLCQLQIELLYLSVNKLGYYLGITMLFGEVLYHKHQVSSRS